jgi:hypothetical protein
MNKPSRPRGRPRAGQPKAANRHSINYSDDENAEIARAAAKVGDEFLGRYVGSRALEWARGVPVYVRKQDGDEAFEAAVVEHFPGYRVLGDANLPPLHIRLGDGPAIPPTAHEIAPKKGYKVTSRLPGTKGTLE